MKKIFYGLLGLIVLLVAAVIAIPFLVPADRIKEELIIATNDATGRTLAIDGDFGISVFPVLGLNSSKVSFSNAPSSSQPNMAEINTLTVELKLLPLLGGQVEVDKFVLDGLVVNLEVDKTGKQNWVFDTASGEAPAKDAKADDAASGADSLGISDLSLGDVQLKNARISYTDQASGTAEVLDNVNLALVLKGLDQPFSAEGRADWNNETINIKTSVGKLRAILENKATSVSAELSGNPLRLTFDGEIATLTPIAVTGQTNLEVPSVKSLAGWVGAPLEARDGTFETLTIEGAVGVKDTLYTFTNSKIAFDKITADGDFKVSLAGKVPSLEGRLDIPELDVNPYLPEDQGEKADTKATPAKADGQKWDDTPFDFSGLKAANAKFDLTVGKILVQEIKIGKSALSTVLKNGVLNAELKELNLYEGVGRGQVVLNASGKTPSIKKSFTMEGISLNPLLTDAADFDRLEGTGLIQFDLAATGNSQKQMVEKLNGNGRILFEDGAIKGINLAAMARNVTNAFQGSGDEQKTDFAELSGTFDIKNGLLTNSDLLMKNPFIRLTGSGTVNMPPQTLDYRLEPKLVASSEGQGGGQAGGIMVPIKITGGWDDPKFAPDLAGALKNVADPSKLKDTLEGSGKKTLEDLGKGGGDAVKDTLKKGLGGFLGGSKN
ncbi:AsmA family protein [Sneathiella chinensis]|uniref:Cell envelope biogenesis protein AsmA n=2 Tax=Alphaproteobacteria TaxID=28211 RepID=A0ABQ5U0I4_9PROT|nr:AsmA family protein [Sneathiella chinensis]GLQ05717.1 cell envelope biogenesis protein AsmA [Sneathiella chinensis]